MPTATISRPIPKTKRLERLVSQVDQTLARLLPAAAQSPSVVHEAMRYCVFSGGKRFRPLVCLGGCEAVGAPARQALSTACAIELIHRHSLVDADRPAMATADARRGKPSCHRQFGEGNAILVGDALLTLAFEILSRNGMPNAMAISRTIGRACGTVGLIGGQVLDLQIISQPRGSTERALTEIAQRKTAALITASVVAGALAGGGSASSVKRLARYGQGIGLAFQLLDDVHDQEGLAQALGMEAARAQAHRLITRAVVHLEPFGRRADTLRELAMWLTATA